jgi:hypothetical protein
MSVPRAELLAAGGFDDQRFRTWGFEDTELGYRLARAGLRGRVALDCVNYHQWHPREWKLGLVAQNARAFLEKHPTFEAKLFLSWLSKLWGEGSRLSFDTMNVLVESSRRDPGLDHAIAAVLTNEAPDAVDRLCRSFERWSGWSSANAVAALGLTNQTSGATNAASARREGETR